MQPSFVKSNDIYYNARINTENIDKLSEFPEKCLTLTLLIIISACSKEEDKYVNPKQQAQKEIKLLIESYGLTENNTLQPSNKKSNIILSDRHRKELLTKLRKIMITYGFKKITDPAKLQRIMTVHLANKSDWSRRAMIAITTNNKCEREVFDTPDGGRVIVWWCSFSVYGGNHFSLGNDYYNANGEYMGGWAANTWEGGTEPHNVPNDP